VKMVGQRTLQCMFRPIDKEEDLCKFRQFRNLI
jgi:hypothetical protein